MSIFTHFGTLVLFKGLRVCVCSNKNLPRLPASTSFICHCWGCNLTWLTCFSLRIKSKGSYSNSCAVSFFLFKKMFFVVYGKRFTWSTWRQRGDSEVTSRRIFCSVPLILFKRSSLLDVESLSWIIVVPSRTSHPQLILLFTNFLPVSLAAGFPLVVNWYRSSKGGQFLESRSAVADIWTSITFFLVFYKVQQFNKKKTSGKQICSMLMNVFLNKCRQRNNEKKC